MLMTPKEEEYLYQLVSLRYYQLLDEYNDYTDRDPPDYFLTEFRVCRLVRSRLHERRCSRV